MMSEARDQLSIRQYGLNLFIVGFLVLFLELACIRWFSAYVIFLQFFTNVALIACFLGMSCGCLAARRRLNWLGWFPYIGLTTVVAAITTFAVYHYWGDLRSMWDIRHRHRKCFSAQNPAIPI
jgi:hypothetical protein